MAITSPTVRSDFDGFLSPTESAPIFEDARKQSVFQQLIPQTQLGINGQKVPVVTAKPTANWVGEGGQKPATEMAMDLLFIDPKKLAAIAVMSAEVVRANPGNINGQLRPYLAEAFAVAFDLAVGYDIGGDGTGTSPFDNPLSATTKSVTLGTTTQANGGIHGDVVAGLKLLVDDGKKLTGFGLDDSVEPDFWGAVDGNGRPLYVDLPTDDTSGTIARPGRLLNRPSFMGEGVGHGDVVAFGGNFRKAAWGVVGGINYRVSTEATVTINGQLTSLWENNLVAVLAEAEYGYVNSDVESIVKYEREAVTP